MNELEQIKKDLRKALKRVGEISRLEAIFNGINYNDLKEYIRLSNICLNKIEKEIEDKKKVTLDEILENASGRYRFNINKTVDGDYGNYWTNHKNKFEAEHEMWRLILKRVAQYLNEKHKGTYDKTFWLNINDNLGVSDNEYDINYGTIIFTSDESIFEAKRIIGEDNIKRALSEEYCRNNPKTE